MKRAANSNFSAAPVGKKNKRNRPLRWPKKSDRLMTSILRGHKNVVFSAVFLPDNKKVVSSSADKTIRVWNTKTYACVRVLRKHTNQVYCLAHTADGKTLASASRDLTTRLWNTQTWQCLHVLKGHTDWVTSVAFSCDGSTLASGSYDKTIKLWHVASGDCTHTVLAFGCILSVAFMPCSHTLAVASPGNALRFWNVKTGQPGRELNISEGYVQSFAVSHDGARVACGTFRSSLDVWCVATNTCLAILKGHTQIVYAAAFSKNDKLLVSGSKDCTARLWNAETGACLRIFAAHTDDVNRVAFSAHGKNLVSASDDCTVRVWSLLDCALLSRASLLLRACAAPYVVLDVVNFLFVCKDVGRPVSKTLARFNDEADFMEFEKILFLNMAQKRFKTPTNCKAL